MEFGIDVNYPSNIIRATSSAEKKMLENRLLQTKLSYQRVDVLKNVNGEIYEGKDFSATGDGSKITIPSFTEDEKRASYYLRMALDANAVKNGCLPLHAAALANNGLTQFIFAKTGKGKSFTLNTLLAYNPRITPIGDDHVVIGRDSISGNGMMRTRDRDGRDKDYSVLHGNRVSPLGRYEVILMDVTTKTEDYKIGGVDLIGKDIAKKAVLKYLSRKPHEPELEKMYDNIVPGEVLTKYHARFNKFMNGAERVLKLSGGQDSILEKLAK